MAAFDKHIADIPSHIFGEASTLCPAQTEPLVEGSSTLSLLFMGVVSLILVAYICWLNYWGTKGSFHRTMFRFLGYHRGDYDAKLEFVRPSFNRYLHSGTMLGVVVMWLSMIVYLQVNSLFYSRLCSVIFLGVVAIYLYQTLAVRLIGLVVNSKSFTSVLLTIKGIFCTLVAIFITPVILCYSLSADFTREVFAYIVGGQIFVAALIFLYETFLLFLTKKVSVLHTILYLCTVEIFPMTLIWGFFCR